ncbi:MAG: hypothetical protein ABSG61_06190 [Gemmatimonadales bacterium]
MKRLLILAMFIPTALLAQRGPYGRSGPFDESTADSAGPRRAYSIGMLAFTGGDWVPSGVDFAMLWRLSERTGTAAGAWVALGSFTQSQSIYFGQSKGFFAGLGVTLRQPIATLLEMGSERTPTFVRLETSLDAGVSRDFNSPLVQGPWDYRASFLVGVSLGSRTALGQSFSLLYGPAFLMGRATTTHGQFVLRVRLPVH